MESIIGMLIVGSIIVGCYFYKKAQEKRRPAVVSNSWLIQDLKSKIEGYKMEVQVLEGNLRDQKELPCDPTYLRKAVSLVEAVRGIMIVYDTAKGEVSARRAMEALRMELSNRNKEIFDVDEDLARDTTAEFIKMYKDQGINTKD